MIIKVSKDGFIPLNKLKDLIDVSQIVSYNLDIIGKNLKIKFYDKNNKLVKPYGASNGKEKSKKVNKNKK